MTSVESGAGRRSPPIRLSMGSLPIARTDSNSALCCGVPSSPGHGLPVTITSDHYLPPVVPHTFRYR
ncbi:hypothetical protein T265_16254, partial [Opisthorchis viverrini]